MIERICGEFYDVIYPEVSGSADEADVMKQL